MPECSIGTLQETPVRHNELSITKTSLRSRAFIQKTSKEKKINNFTGGNQKKNRKLPFSTEVHRPVITLGGNKEEECGVASRSRETSAMTVDEKKDDSTTMSEGVLSSGSDDMVEESFFREQHHSTPRVVQFSANAVSSTPNQQMFKNSRLMRNVFTQTTFTLTSKEPVEFDEHLKSFCLEIADKRNSPFTSCAQKSFVNNGTTSPLSNMCTNKFINYEGTPVQKMQSIRKLSLRSKTMICSAIEKSKDRPNVIARHKSMEEKRLFSNTFSLMPHHKTPPSCSAKVLHNPFEVDLPERLGKTIFSPDVFENVMSPSEDSDYLRWTIEDISSINPVAIEEDFSFPSDDEDPERESQVQQEIDRYFSETHVVLSPDGTTKPSINIPSKEDIFSAKAVASTPQKMHFECLGKSKNVAIQTALTLPNTLPEELEESLKIYFKFFEEDDLSLNASTLRRKLFFHSEDEPPSPVRFETCSSPGMKDLLKTDHSPYTGASNERHFTPVTHQEYLSSPEVSPVVATSSDVKMKNDSLTTCKKTLHLYFPSHPRYEKEAMNVVVVAGDMDTSVLPSSQDTGYHTEDSWQQTSQKLHFSTPTRTAP